MTATEIETERGAITRLVVAYIDGARTGDADKLMEAFDPRAWMFGSIGGERVDIPIGEMIEMLTAQPMGKTYQARITSVEQVGNAARVTLDETGCWESAAFTDFFGLSKIAGEWKIVSKVFVHTGGMLPSG
jgi:hypothetical protein